MRMKPLVFAGARLQCSFGTTPSALIVLPANRVLTGPQTATVMDNIPNTKPAPIGMCNLNANPAVSAATAAASRCFDFDVLHTGNTWAVGHWLSNRFDGAKRA